jgi:hypothetical protein
LTKPREVISTGGRKMGDFQGNWANIGGRFGLLVAGGAGMHASEQHGKNMEQPNPSLLLEGSRGTGTGNRGAVALPLIGATQTRELSQYLYQPEPTEGWSALLTRAPDHTSRFAVARWSGPATTTIKLIDRQWAPVFSIPTSIDGASSTVVWTFKSLGSTGEIVRFFAVSDGPVTGTAVDDSHASFSNRGQANVKLRLAFTGSDGKERLGSLVLNAGQTVTVAGSDFREKAAQASR